MAGFNSLQRFVQAAQHREVAVAVTELRSLSKSISISLWARSARRQEPEEPGQDQPGRQERVGKRALYYQSLSTGQTKLYLFSLRPFETDQNQDRHRWEMDQPKRLLRPRRKMKSPEKDRMLLTNHLSPRSRKSIVLVKRLSTKKEKVPIYKRSLPEHSAHNGSEVYDFNFDINDSKERLTKKRRRKIAAKKTLVNKKQKKITSRKQAVKKVVNKEAEANNVPLVAPKENNVKSTRVIMQEDNVEFKNTIVKSPAVTFENNVNCTDVASKETEKKSTDEELLQTGNCMKPINENQLPANAEKNEPNNVELSKEPLVQSSLAETASTKLLAENITEKPKVSIRSVQVFNNKVVTTNNSQISKSDDFRPFRPTNIFNNKFLIQQRNALNSSLFEKSLSPITKLYENTELSSPWRSPPIRTFSQVRNLFQSTPQNMKQEISSKRSLKTITNESKNYENAVKRKSSFLENNENVSPGYISTNHSRKKNSTISRKFGTEITNIDHSVQSNMGEEISGRLSMEVENMQSSIQLSNRINSSVNNYSVLHSTENSVHNASNAHTPKKNFKIEASHIQSPQKIIESMQAHACVQKENLDPQPGPSGMQKGRVLGKRRGVLLQTSLNNFLNIPDMPESTMVQTPHGIFDDISSTPISKSAKKPKISNSELKNAFGFCDDDSRQDISPVKQKVTNYENKKPFARISIGQIKNQFLSKKPKMSIQPLMNTTNEVAKIEEVPAKPKQDVLVDIANFSDTFDVQPENDETPGTNTSEIPLFYDLEPSHFKEPPRYSYKRKRNVKFSFSDEEVEEVEKEQVEVKTKRKKVDRAKNGQDHKISKWAEDINKAFSEIDQFELVVE
ncbi:uncharacterized protein LOC143210402 [Lasioglossum baleicum]|uniref:uncharacterized protein LOC143210402 n=1 Tax=Lasioglossum baleicum TaxID=434251 RepID=UPI003FCD2E11